MQEQDWNEVVLRKKGPSINKNKKEQSINIARRQGVQIDTSVKYNAGKNIQQRGMQKDARKLEEEPEDLSHEQVGLELRIKIQQARQAKGMTQKELAQKINEQQRVVNDYEAGRAIPNNFILGKMERILGVKLRGGRPKKGKK